VQGPAAQAALADLGNIAPVVSCADLLSFDLTGAVGAKAQIKSATQIEDGRPAPYCRVLGTIEPAVQIEVRLPLTVWTQRFLQTGCGGLCGNLNINVGRIDGCAPATNGEIALASTDMGHSNHGAEDNSWAVDDPRTHLDFGYRAEHLTAVAAKALIRKYYGQAPKYSYFSGCSDGGREALMEAERYPGDFDGIAAGAPAMNFITQNTFYHGWNAIKNTGADGQAILTADKLPILHKAALDACDEIDGLKDGLISNPTACRFDPAVTICKEGQDAATCLTPAQANTAKEIYLGAHDALGHKFVISGPQPGSELAWQGVYVPQGAGPIFSTGISLGTIRYLAYVKALPATFRLADFISTRRRSMRSNRCMPSTMRRTPTFRSSLPQAVNCCFITVGPTRTFHRSTRLPTTRRCSARWVMRRCRSSRDCFSSPVVITAMAATGRSISHCSV
jgi:hypothetical protein